MPGTRSRHTARLSSAAQLATLLVLLGLAASPGLALRNPPGRDNGRGGMPVDTLQAAVADDPHEPNDSPETATSLEWVRGEDGAFEAQGAEALIADELDLDFYALELTAGDSLVAWLEPDSGSRLDPLLTLLGPSGEALAHAAGDSALIGLTIAADGRYLLLAGDRALLAGRDLATSNLRRYVLVARRLARKGDLDGNGRIDYRDAFLVFLVFAGLTAGEEFTPARLLAADLDGDGRTAGDLDDFLLALRAAAGSVPRRDPGQTGKGAALAAAMGQWRLECPDGSALVLALGDTPVRLARPGVQAEALLARAGQLPSHPAGASALTGNYPNPFNPSTRIEFFLARECPVRLAVHDLQGRRVRLLAEGRLAAGSHAVMFDGRDGRGKPLPSGVYFCRLEAEGRAGVRKLTLVR